MLDRRKREIICNEQIKITTKNNNRDSADGLFIASMQSANQDGVRIAFDCSARFFSSLLRSYHSFVLFFFPMAIAWMRRSFLRARFISTIELTRQATANKPIDWNDLLEWLKNGQTTLLWRTEQCAQRYIEHQKTVADQYVSINDYIRIHYLHWQMNIDPGTQKRVAVPCSTSIKEPLLTLNKFPYYLVEDIQHWLIWCDPVPREPQKLIDTISDREFPPEKFDRITFVNPPRLRSIAGVFHAHVFTREIRRSE